ncbi:MAG TPA: putative metal-binding motif-containing protein, partial [Myxococcota bacterium]|nr:putative metal-binding motif-containing protein [Myxococcota bacterium]
MTRLLTLLVLAACTNDSNPDVKDKPPTVTFIRPVSGTTFDPADPLSLCLQVDDELPVENLELSLQSSLDGFLWEPTEPPAECAAGGGNVELEVSLTEGTHTLSMTAIDPRGQTGTGEITITATPNTAPTCTLIAPVEGSVYELGSAVEINAAVADAEYEAGRLSVTVTSSIDGEIYSGTPDSSGQVYTSTSLLTGGDHVLELKVTDPRGLTDACSANITVNVCLDDDLDGFTTCDGDCDDNQSAANPDAEELADGFDNNCDGTV